MNAQPQLAPGKRVVIREPHNQAGVVTRVTTGARDDTLVYFARLDGQTEESGPYAEVEAE